MNRLRVLAFSSAVSSLAVGSFAAETKDEPRRFEWTTKSDEAKKLLVALQERIESFQTGPDIVEAAKRIVAADPEFAMGEYYASAVIPPPDNQAYLDRAVELSKKASDGERRFIETMVVVRANNGANFQDGIPAMEKLAADYTGERLVFMLLGQLYQGTNANDKARTAFERALAIGPTSPRARSFIANEDLLHGRFAAARSEFESIEKTLPKGSVPFAIRYGVTFSHLYEANVDGAIASLKTYLDEYKGSGSNQAFPEVFIWNSIARINLEAGRAEEAMRAYEKGYESVPASSLPEDQRQVWLGRLRHGKCRVLAKMGKHEEAWAEAEKVRQMIDAGGEPAKQYYLPAYHYLVGYLKLERGDLDAAVEHLKQANQTDPFQKLLLARAYERKGIKDSARAVYQEVVDSTANGIERALAYPEAKRKLTSLS